MIVIEKNEGPKIPYTVTGKKVTFDDDLTVNLASRQRDWETDVDVCSDEDGNLVLGAAAGRYYVAQLTIPAKQYTEPEGEDEAPQPIPLDMDDVTLALWALVNYTPVSE